MKLENLKKGKQPYRALIIDDMGDTLINDVREKIECNMRHLELDTVNRLIQKGGDNFFLNTDILFFDATYEDRKTDLSALTFAEYLIRKNPEYANIIKILIGNDIVKHGSTGDFEVQYLIERVKKLPHLIYGNQYGTKSECIVKYIKYDAKKRGLEVLDKLVEENVRQELLDKTRPYISDIPQNLSDQSRISMGIMQNLSDFEPQNASEKALLDKTMELANLLMHNQHLISQVYASMNFLYNLHLSKKDEIEDERE